MKTIHVYQRGIHGWGLFYRREDYLVHFTLFSVISREMNLRVVAFSPMFNHTHAGFADILSRELERFQRRLNGTLVSQYNQDYRRTGPLLDSPYGRSKKTGAKIILGNVAYIFNNCVAGRMFESAPEYRWNLLAYRDCQNPFSERIYREYRSSRMRKAMSRVDYCYSCGWFLNYTVLRSLFAGLDEVETEQLTDYIVSKYNFLDYRTLDRLYGNHENLVLALKSTAGSEYDLAEEYEDHSRYMKMAAAAEKLGYSGVNYETMDYREKNQLIRQLTRLVNPSRDQIRRFFHLK